MTKTIKLKTKVFTKLEDLIKVNNELGEKAQKGELIPLRKEKNLLQLAEPRINGIWDIILSDKGTITKIVLW